MIVPYRGDEGGPRDAAWAYVQRWWADNHPNWTVTSGHPGEGPWSKGAAVADALRRRPPDAHTALVVADADVICAGVAAAVAAVGAGAGWAVPHGRVLRLTRHATEAVYAGAALPDPSAAPARRAPHQRPSGPVAESYTGIAGGGVLVLPADRYRQSPLDPRFRNWGQEDAAWGHALTVLFGHPWRGHAPLYHLWHPTPLRLGESIDPRVVTRMSRSIGNPEGLALYRRYRSARTAAEVRAILAELE